MQNISGDATGSIPSCIDQRCSQESLTFARLKLVHLKDVQASGGEVDALLGKGISKIPEVMRELHRQGFAHLIAIEYEKKAT